MDGSRYNRLVDHVGIHDQRRLTEALCKGSLVRRKEYPTESSPQAKVKTSKSGEEAPRTPSSHEIFSSLASSPRPTTFGNELGSAKRVATSPTLEVDLSPFRAHDF
ncbi:hypothetical protein Taro_037132 [Colocasia esculenta]|uniref:Uncharacterized protein n=1 Tax=Colocasia esculenta TaxID=4460 RepID=A0A843WJV9_COLES|nr:hypothetical protein [Colocasia esculenta]